MVEVCASRGVGGLRRLCVDAQFDIILVGGGLQNCLLVQALAHHSRNLRIALVEAGEQLAGNHTWCLHRGDVTDGVWAWLAPLVQYQWPAYRVAFPQLDRRVALPYCALTSDRVARVTMQQLSNLGATVRLQTRAAVVERDAVTLQDGTRWTAALVVDARGPEQQIANHGQGFLKFAGLEVETARPHGMTEPLLMDARVPQDDGFRFVYVLPLSERRLLVEDTCFSDNAALDVPAYLQRARQWLTARDLGPWHEIRSENGVLTMPWAWHDPPADRLVGGMAGGWFHPLTGYSLAEAARLADAVAQTPLADVNDRWIAAHRTDLQRRGRLARLLCRALFRHTEPGDRATLLARFYRRPDAVIGRFYALQSTLADAWTILAGPPPRGLRLWPRASSAPQLASYLATLQEER